MLYPTYKIPLNPPLKKGEVKSRNNTTKIGQGFSLAKNKKPLVGTAHPTKMTAEEPIKYQPKLPDELKSDLATHFFYVFMRFEYTLKASNYYKGKINEKVEPDWDKFAVKLEGIFQNPSLDKFEDAVNYFKETPPKKQIINNNKELDWKPMPINTNAPLAKEILICVRRVRNNLFHGGKASKISLFEPRDDDLLKHSLVILEKCLSEMSELKTAFDR